MRSLFVVVVLIAALVHQGTAQLPCKWCDPQVRPMVPNSSNYSSTNSALAKCCWVHMSDFCWTEVMLSVDLRTKCSFSPALCYSEFLESSLCSQGSTLCLIVMLTKMFCIELQHTYIPHFNTHLLTDTESHKSITTYLYVVKTHIDDIIAHCTCTVTLLKFQHSPEVNFVVGHWKSCSTKKILILTLLMRVAPITRYAQQPTNVVKKSRTDSTSPDSWGLEQHQLPWLDTLEVLP